MLLVSYTPSCWFFESVEMLRKFLLTSVVLVVAPNTRVQLWFGLVVSVSFAILTSTLRPYRDPLPALVQTLALLQVVFDYASATLFFTDPALVVRGTLQEHSYAAAVGIVLVITNLLAFLVLSASIVLALRAQRRVLREFRLTDADGARLHLEPPAAGAGGFHLFLSHQWKWGQDQAGTLKSALQALLPELRCFLDVDSLKDIGQLEAHVRESDLVLIVLTQGYVESKNCRRELREALEQGKRLLVLRETDANHGAISLDELRLEASLLPLEADRTAANAIARIIEVGDSLEWHREGHLKRVTLAAIVQDLFDLQVSAGGAAAATVRVTCPGGDSPRSSPAAVRVRARLLDAYLVGAPGVHAQVAEALRRGESRCSEETGRRRRQTRSHWWWSSAHSSSAMQLYASSCRQRCSRRRAQCMGRRMAMGRRTRRRAIGWQWPRSGCSRPCGSTRQRSRLITTSRTARSAARSCLSLAC